jgi:hypothetical protein
MIVHKVNAAMTRLSDEEPDLMEQEDIEGFLHGDGQATWTSDDLIDIKRIIETKMPEKQREVLEAYILGHNAEDLDVTEKYWRYHLKRAITLIKKEMGLT